ncbi:MAG TPA: hypothetical protein VGO11_14215 [Chthoniobacteraceae bacterium]|jgi:hypothetical protein|nr:hypothetical protein [Chthoniobacteraceae bacterium]
MRSSLKLLCALAFLTLATGLTGTAKSDKPADKTAATPDPKKKKDDPKKADAKKGDDKKKGPKKKGDDKDDNDGNGPKLNLPLVERHPATGLKIPYTDAKGKLEMIYYIGTATRLDANLVDMKDSKVETYNDEGEVEMTVDLPVSQLDLNTKIITSNTETTIKRDDFIITGDSVRFETVKKLASLVGHVHMIVYDKNDEAATPPPAPALEPAPAPANE